MIVKQLIEELTSSPNQALHIMLPNGTFVANHFHITEVALVNKRFIDCGGTKREKTYCTLQAWVASDVDHRLQSSKLAKILNLAQSDMGLSDLPVEIEYETDVVSQYPLVGIEHTPSGLLFLTDVKHTACLAPDKCGVSGCC